MKKSELPPGPKAGNPLGHLISFRRDTIGFLTTIAREYGDIVHFKIGPIRIVLLNHPDLIKEVLTTQHQRFVKGRPLEMAKELLGEGLLTSEGEFHKRQSRLLQPAFHRNVIESCAGAITDCISLQMKGWEEDMQVDMKEEMTNMSIVIAGRTMFGANVEQEAKEINEALNAATKLFGRISLPFSELLLRIPLPSTRRFFKAKARLDDTIFRMISERRRNEAPNKDLLSLLLDSQNEKSGGGRMSDQQVRDEAITLFLTAFDTTSTALTWAWYMLSQNPEAEAELHEELDRVLNGRTPTADDVNNLKYTRMVFGESMRMYPPSYVIARQALEDFKIDKFVLPRGTIILLSPYLIHHDARFRADPEKFSPHAWDTHSRSVNSKYEYIPFSRGPRSCIGEPLAWMQGVLVIATIAQSWHIKLSPGHAVELLPLMNLRPKYGMVMTLHRRRKKNDFKKHED